MKYFMQKHFIQSLFGFLLTLSLAGLQAGKAPETSASYPPEKYYTAKDFTSVKKFDVHIHINTEETTFIDQAKADNFRFLDIVDDRPFGVPMNEQQRIAILDLKKFPDQMVFATTFTVNTWDNKDWVEETIASLKKSFDSGAKAVKIWKNIGMALKDKNGKFVMVDDPKLDPVLDFLAKNHIALIGHNGEPRDCWLPLDKMTFSQDYYGAHPEYHMYLHPDYPSYQDQINARDHMLKKHPDLKFVGAHLGSLEWSLDELAKRLDEFPNMSVDVSRMSNLKLHTLNNWQKAHDFFIKYQDRLLYGTDTQIKESDPVSMKKSVHENWLRDWIFFATNDAITLPKFGALRGVHLPQQVIDKIYYKNAERWLKGSSK